MQVYQPMLFVGLGGTGCQIGSELERRMRDELCGPDGTLLQRLDGELLPHELPKFVQFVYADLNQSELDNLNSRAGASGLTGDNSAPVVASSAFIRAAERTRHLARDLVPPYKTYQHLAQSLRLTSPDHVASWLPPVAGEPLVGPLQVGAGQVPTVGRAALFETLRDGLGSATAPINAAIGQIQQAAAHLSSHLDPGNGAVKVDTPDVFVAFSVAGGTGSGIFYDYLHLIASCLRTAGMVNAQIYPIVLMPSTFDEGLGGGRVARLNSGRALLDLFRLIDDQNAKKIDANIAASIDVVRSPDKVHVRYPHSEPLEIDGSTIQTGFLFSRSGGMSRADLQQSIVSLVLSLIATKPMANGGQTFAASFINNATARQNIAPSGIGNRGVSTGLVASMTTPTDELADIVSARLLAEAVAGWSAPPLGNTENNHDLVVECFTASGISPLWTRAAPIIAEFAPLPLGKDKIAAALNERGREMLRKLDELRRELPQFTADLASSFDPGLAAKHVFGKVEIFRSRRILLGDGRLAQPFDKLGFEGVLSDRRMVPQPPRPEFTTTPPAPPAFSNPKLAKLRWADEPVKQFRLQQDLWYTWQVRTIWHHAWAQHEPTWRPKLDYMHNNVVKLTDRFIAHQNQTPTWMTGRIQELYTPRTGVSYLLPPRSADLDVFYRATTARWIDANGANHKLNNGASPGEIARAMLGPETWRSAYEDSLNATGEAGPNLAVSAVRQKLKQTIKGVFRQRPPGQQPLLPSLHDLLATAAGGVMTNPVASDAELGTFKGKIAALVPGGFVPPGSGRLKVHIAYQGPADQQIEQFLRNSLNIPNDAMLTSEPSDAEAVTVVFFRSDMSVTEVPELRQVMREWGNAVNKGDEADLLRWRQRVSYDFSYLMTARWHRIRILYRLLAAMWAGQVHITAGPPESPESIAISVRPGADEMMNLKLRRLGNASSWASVIRAYEAWTIDDDGTYRAQFCEELMKSRPLGVDGNQTEPSELYQLVTGMAEDQLKALNERRPSGANSMWTMFTEFWSDLVPEAMDQPLVGMDHHVLANSLRDLEASVR